jgi:hypothetical protein
MWFQVICFILLSIKKHLITYRFIILFLFQGTDYTAIRARVESLRTAIQESGEGELENQWYRDEFAKGYGFSTYRPDTVPNVIYEELKYRDTGNSFLNFGMDVLKMPAVPTEAFSRNRPTASEAQSWLERGLKLIK